MTPEFEIFWNTYGKKVGLRKAQEKWEKLSREDKDAIFEHVPLYVESTPDRQFRKDPCTYLNNYCWEDEIILPEKPKEKVLPPLNRPNYTEL